MKTPYPELNDVLNEMVSSIQAILHDNLVGAYLQGSFAVGDFDEHSDVDFIIVIDQALTDRQVEALQIMHPRIYKMESAWAQHLEGSYFPKDILRDVAHAGQPLWYLDNGSQNLIESDHCNTVLVRSVMRDFGVTLTGADPASLVDSIPVDTLRREMMHTLQQWGQEILDDPEQYRNYFYQTYIVLNFCRMLHDLGQGKPGSKLAGANWAKANLASSWQGLIDRTWAGRPKPEEKVWQRPDPDDFAATLKFIQYVMDQARTDFPQY